MTYPRYKNITYGVNTTGNIQALLLNLNSVAMQTVLPAKVVVRTEGEFPSFSNFYLEQLADLFRLKSVEFSIHLASSKGARVARQWHLDNCTTDFFWGGDDDVVFDSDCLSILYNTSQTLEIYEWGYIGGTKADVNNRRGYKDFNTSINPSSEIKDECNYNVLYEPRKSISPVKIKTLDTGNMFLNIRELRESKVSFTPFKESANCSGEDTIFALECSKNGFMGWYVPEAVAYHLEKPIEHTQFNEFAARKEMLLRACEVNGYDKEIIKKEFMRFIKVQELS